MWKQPSGVKLRTHCPTQWSSNIQAQEVKIYIFDWRGNLTKAFFLNITPSDWLRHFTNKQKRRHLGYAGRKVSASQSQSQRDMAKLPFGNHEHLYNICWRPAVVAIFRPGRQCRPQSLSIAWLKSTALNLVCKNVREPSSIWMDDSK